MSADEIAAGVKEILQEEFGVIEEFFSEETDTLRELGICSSLDEFDLCVALKERHIPDLDPSFTIYNHETVQQLAERLYKEQNEITARHA